MDMEYQNPPLSDLGERLHPKPRLHLPIHPIKESFGVYLLFVFMIGGSPVHPGHKPYSYGMPIGRSLVSIVADIADHLWLLLSQCLFDVFT